jgi:hypothetical protein
MDKVQKLNDSALTVILGRVCIFKEDLLSNLKLLDSLKLLLRNK